MTTPHPRRIAFSVSWGHERTASLTIDSLVLQLLLVAALCAGFYDLGLRQSRVVFERAPATSILASAEPVPREGREPLGVVPEQGAPLDQSKDIITPLNVRDASALVMGIGAGDPPAPAAEPPPVPSSRVRELNWREQLLDARPADAKAPN